MEQIEESGTLRMEVERGSFAKTSEELVPSAVIDGEMSRVRVGKSVTVNLGNHCFGKISVSLEMPVATSGKAIEDGMQWVVDKVDDRLNRELQSLQDWGRGLNS